MRETKHCARTTEMHAMHSPGNVKPIVSSHKKGTVPGKNKAHICQISQEWTVPEKTNYVISQEKGLLLKKTNCCVISTRKGPLLEKNKLLCHLTRKGLLLQQTKTPNNIVATGHKMRVDLWNLVTTYGMALRLENLIAWGFCITPIVVKQCF